MLNRGSRCALAALAAIALAVIGSPLARAQAQWPAQTIKLVVPFPAGGGTDILARIIAERLRVSLKQPVVIENRPGATGNIGNEAVARAAPDGYTVLVQGTIIGMFPHVFTKLSYDPVRDLAAVGTIAESPNVVVTNPAVPVQTLKELVSWVRAKGEPVSYATAGIASPQHLATEQLARLADMKLQHITYKGTAPAVNDVVGNHVPFGTFSLSSMLSLIQSNRVRAIAVTSTRRTPLLPDVPTVVESGFAADDSAIRFLLLVPAATPRDIVDRLNVELNRALAEPAVRDAYLKAGYVVIRSTPEEAAAMVRREHDAWGPIVRELGLRIE